VLVVQRETASPSTLARALTVAGLVLALCVVVGLAADSDAAPGLAAPREPGSLQGTP